MLDDDIIDAIRERQSARARLARSIGTPAPGADAIRPAPATPRHLPVLADPVAVADVHFSDDRFRCARLSCELSASTCVDRQQMANQPRRHSGRLSSYELAMHATSSHMATCRSCDDGRAVANRLLAIAGAKSEEQR